MGHLASKHFFDVKFTTVTHDDATRRDATAQRHNGPSCVHDVYVHYVYQSSTEVEIIRRDDAELVTAMLKSGYCLKK